MKRHFEARSLEWFGGLWLTAWGAYVILTPSLFDAQYSYHAMTYFMPQEVWGFFAFTGGLIRVVALFINGRWGITPMIRVATSFISVFLWFSITAGIYLSGMPSTGFILYPGLMLADMFCAYRAAGDGYEASVMKRLEKLAESPNVHRLTGRTGITRS